MFRNGSRDGGVDTQMRREGICPDVRLSSSLLHKARDFLTAESDRIFLHLSLKPRHFLHFLHFPLLESITSN